MKDADRSPRTPWTLRRVLFQLHLWTGLIFCLPFVILGISGTILTYDEELADLAGVTPHARAQGAMQAPEAIVAAALQGREGYRAIGFAMPSEQGDAAIVRINRPQPQQAGRRPSRGMQIFVDPVSLDVLGTREGFALPIIRIAHDLHGHMMISGWGRPFVGWLGVFMVGLGFTGLYMWWPRKGRVKDAFTVRRNAKGLRLHRDLHGAVGIWSLIVFMVVSISGVAITFPRSFSAMVFAEAPQGEPRGSGGNTRRVEGEPRISLSDAISRAERAVPDAAFLSAALPNGGEAFRVTMAERSAAKGAPAITVSVNSQNGAIDSVRDPREAGIGDRIMAWQRPLHGGHGLGEVWKFLVALSGLLPVLFVVTGIAMWAIKRRRRLPQYEAPDARVAEAAPAE